jgi:hypothetical protein
LIHFTANINEFLDRIYRPYFEIEQSAGTAWDVVSYTIFAEKFVVPVRLVNFPPVRPRNENRESDVHYLQWFPMLVHMYLETCLSTGCLPDPELVRTIIAEETSRYGNILWLEEDKPTFIFVFAEHGSDLSN